MSVSPEYRAYVVGQLTPLVPLRVRPMFGELGLYAGEHFFAVIADDALYLKVDASNRADYEAAGMGPFAPGGADARPMSYFQVPEEVIEDRPELRLWVEKAVAVAERTKPKPRKKK
ncbi:TfoX/Sxy family protein [Oscillochloris sp. ZM17-4]|uniref:TfoX/Sxy family protein n=1 Tax=Oscillochloris sp. ZM17-4 TaxID=2866714 RepID=UPI001C738233|nr:TfoX/Sxy family protein [Oscillochloris sp. ZM17-4]MBX0329345.1 TfoX/Sxy family protein [Oscillochloris sp. ZM17-4]